jgi:hypothetical protein
MILPPLVFLVKYQSILKILVSTNWLAFAFRASVTKEEGNIYKLILLFGVFFRQMFTSFEFSHLKLEMSGRGGGETGLVLCFITSNLFTPKARAGKPY